LAGSRRSFRQRLAHAHAQPVRAEIAFPGLPRRQADGIGRQHDQAGTDVTMVMMTGELAGAIVIVLHLCAIIMFCIMVEASMIVIAVLGFHGMMIMVLDQAAESQVAMRQDGTLSMLKLIEDARGLAQGEYQHERDAKQRAGPPELPSAQPSHGGKPSTGTGRMATFRPSQTGKRLAGLNIFSPQGCDTAGYVDAYMAVINWNNVQTLFDRYSRESQLTNDERSGCCNVRFGSEPALGLTRDECPLWRKNGHCLGHLGLPAIWHNSPGKLN